MSRPSVLIDHLLGVGNVPATVYCGRFILGMLKDVGAGAAAGESEGASRLQKRRHGRSRDDVAVAGVLAGGALVRELEQPQRSRWALPRRGVM